MISRLTCLLIMCSPVAIQAQSNLDHKALMNPVWEAFGDLMFKVKYKNGQSTYTPVFPPNLLALNNKQVSLSGYMIPIKVGLEHNSFMLSVLPTEQCAFCGKNDIPPMVQVKTKNGTKLTYEEKPINIKGQVNLNSSLNGEAEIQVLNAIKTE